MASGNFPWKRAIKNIVAFLVVGGFLFYLWEHRHELTHALNVTGSHIAALSVLILLTWVISGLQAVVIYRAVQVPVRASEGIALTVAGTFGNYLPMRAGTILRALYLKNVHGLRIARFGGITALRTLLTIIAAGLVGLFGLLLVWLETGPSATSELVIIFILLAAAPATVMLLPLPQVKRLPPRLQRWANDVTDAYDELRRKPVVAFQVVGLLIAQFLVLGLRFIVSADALGADMPLSFLVMMAPLAALMSYIAITPGGLGVREAVMGFVSLNLGYSFADGIFVGTVDRAVLLAMVAFFGGIAFYTLWRKVGVNTTNESSLQRP